jgi:TDG/mug DNA glycosylase family protein
LLAWRIGVLSLGEEVLSDILKEGLKIVFIGTASSDISAQVGHYYANPRNSFWVLLYEAGLTDKKLLPKEDHQVLQYDLGLTDVIKSQHSGADTRLAQASESDVENVRRKIERYKPKFVCFTSMNAYKAFSGHKAESFGSQLQLIRASEVFVTPSPSARVASTREFNGKTRLQWYKELARLSR